MPQAGLCVARLRKDGLDGLGAGVDRAAGVEKTYQHGSALSAEAERGIRGARLGSLRNTPRITELIILLSISFTPRQAMQKWLGLHHQRQAVGLGLFLDQVGQLHHGFFLDLRDGP